MRVGEKEVSEQAEIVRRFADLFSREQLDALARGRAGGLAATSASGSTALRKTCESGLISAQLAEREDELENRLLAERVTFKGEEMPLRNAQAKLAVLPELRRPRGARRDPGRRECRGSTRTAWSCSARARSSLPSTRASPTRSSGTRRRRGSRCASSRVRCKQASDDSAAELRGAARALVHPAARPRPRRGAVELPHRLDAPALAARVDLHEGARDRDLPRDARGARLRPDRADRTSSSISTTARRSRRAPA